MGSFPWSQQLVGVIEAQGELEEGTELRPEGGGLACPVDASPSSCGVLPSELRHPVGEVTGAFPRLLSLGMVHLLKTHFPSFNTYSLRTYYV